MRHAYLESVLRQPAVRLISAQNAPLIISFLYEEFIRKGRRAIRHAQLIAALDDALFALRSEHGPDRYKDDAAYYLTEWSSEKSGFLSKRLHDAVNEAEYDLTADTEKAILWVESLERRPFVAASSRFLQLYNQLAELAYLVEPDMERKLAEKRRQRDLIDLEIQRLEAGSEPIADPALIRDHFLGAEETARSALGDFRGVEHNLRELNRSVYTSIATSDAERGSLAAEALDAHDLIWETDQGKSFRALFELLMAQSKQREIEQLVTTILSDPALARMAGGSILKTFLPSVVDAGIKVHEVTCGLVEKLASFVADRRRPESRRFMELVKRIEKLAVDCAAAPPDEAVTFQVPGLSATISMTTERPLFTPARQYAIAPPEAAESESAELSEGYRQMLNQHSVDVEQLKSTIRDEVARHGQVTITELAERHPFVSGLAQVIHYVKLAQETDTALICSERTVPVRYFSASRQIKVAHLPEITFVAAGASATKEHTHG